MISKELEKTIGFAVQLAHEAKHEFVTTEHLLLALIDNQSALAVLTACSVDIDQLRRDLLAHLAEQLPDLGDQENTKRTGAR